MVELRLFGMSEHEANTAAVEEGQAPGGEQQRETEDVPVERCGAVDVVDVNRYLSQPGDGDGRGGGRRGIDSGWFGFGRSSFVVRHWSLADNVSLRL